MPRTSDPPDYRTVLLLDWGGLGEGNYLLHINYTLYVYIYILYLMYNYYIFLEPFKASNKYLDITDAFKHEHLPNIKSW